MKSDAMSLYNLIHTLHKVVIISLFVLLLNPFAGTNPGIHSFRIPVDEMKDGGDEIQYNSHHEHVENNDNVMKLIRISTDATSRSPARTENHGAAFQPSFCGLTPVPPPKTARIVGGKEAWVGQFPWQVQLHVKPVGKDYSRFQCGGTLVSENLIVTAAHCITSNNMKDYSIVMGKQKQDTNYKSYNEQHLNAKEILVHPSYSKHNLLNDIALIWVESKYNQTARFTDYIQPACLPHHNANVESLYQVGEHGIVSGWGLLDENHKTGSETLQHVSVPIVDSTKCIRAYSRLVQMDSNLQFCAGNNRGQDACAGDSGGPFVTKFGNRIVLLGVVSFGKGCARQEYPGVYTKVHSYMPWILKEVAKRTTTVTSNICQNSNNQTSVPAKDPPETAKPVTQAHCEDGRECGKPPIDVPEIKNFETTGPFCTGAFKYIKCKRGKSLHILEAFYGRSLIYTKCEPSGRDTSSTSERAAASVTKCEMSNAKSIVKKRCQNRRSCWIYHRLFTRAGADPCPGKPKFALVKYVCK